MAKKLYYLRACLNFIKVFYMFFFLDKKERKNQDKTIYYAQSHPAPRFVGLALWFQITLVKLIRGGCPRMVRT